MRKSVKQFAEEMEKVLKKHDHKGGWKYEHFSYLYGRLNEEVGELESSIPPNENLNSLTPRALDVIIKECCDIANFAMMIADNAKRLKANK